MKCFTGPISEILSISRNLISLKVWKRWWKKILVAMCCDIHSDAITNLLVQETLIFRIRFIRFITTFSFYFIDFFKIVYFWVEKKFLIHFMHAVHYNLVLYIYIIYSLYTQLHSSKTIIFGLLSYFITSTCKIGQKILRNFTWNYYTSSLYHSFITLSMWMLSACKKMNLRARFIATTSHKIFWDFLTLTL